MTSASHKPLYWTSTSECQCPYSPIHTRTARKGIIIHYLYIMKLLFVRWFQHLTVRDTSLQCTTATASEWQIDVKFNRCPHLWPVCLIRHNNDTVSKLALDCWIGTTGANLPSPPAAVLHVTTKRSHLPNKVSCCECSDASKISLNCTASVKQTDKLLVTEVRLQQNYLLNTTPNNYQSNQSSAQYGSNHTT